MRDGRLARCLLYPALLVAVVGCQIFYRYRPVAVLARDAETRRPIPGAEVRISYPLAQSYLGPHESSAPTGEDGIVRLRAAPCGESGVLLEAAAAGYLSASKVVPSQDVQAIAPAHLFEAVERRPINFTLELYAEEPHPAVILMLPAGYRGQVQADIQVQEGTPSAPGRRFTCAVPPSGPVVVTGPAFLRHLSPADFSAAYAGGGSLGTDAQGPDVGFWCLKAEEGSYTFLVGTREEYERSRPRHQGGVEERRPSGGGGKGSGRGRGGRRGGNQPAPGY